jgi:assimilatory nitrate reductase catalytic subunit
LQHVGVEPRRRLVASCGTAHGQVGAGETVCACFNVGRTPIEKTIRGEGLRSAEAIGACLQSGINCVSCLPELGRILEQTLDRGAA